MHSPATHAASGGQALSQLPQCAVLVSVSMQRLPHAVSPFAHRHFPARHSAVGGHTVSQLPQWLALVCTSTHSLPQSTPDAQLEAPEVPPALSARPPVADVSPETPPDGPNSESLLELQLASSAKATGRRSVASRIKPSLFCMGFSIASDGTRPRERGFTPASRFRQLLSSNFGDRSMHPGRNVTTLLEK